MNSPRRSSTTRPSSAPPWIRLAWIFAIGLVVNSSGTLDQLFAQPTPVSDEASKPTETRTTPPRPKTDSKAESAPRSSKPFGIISKAEADRLKPRSPFLSPPGTSPGEAYGQEELELPPWRQTTFFGIQAKGQFFIYVLDGSGSMIDENRFPRATIELRRSVFALQPPQRFEVIFYNEQSIPMPGGPIPRPADLKSKTALLQWLRIMEPDGGTCAVPALAQAIALHPDAIFFLSDGALPDGTVESVTRLNKVKIPIHCIDLAGGLGGDQLRRIAKQNGGQYASRAGSLQNLP